MRTKTTTKTLTASELIAKAADWDTTRRTRAIVELGNYKQIPGSSALVNRQSGEIYEATATRRKWSADGQGEITGYTGCTCPDALRCAEMHEAMRTAGCGCTLACKHHYIRQMLMGGAVRIGASTFRAKRNPK